jgi:hypothetical protein
LPSPSSVVSGDVRATLMGKIQRFNKAFLAICGTPASC